MPPGLAVCAIRTNRATRVVWHEHGHGCRCGDRRAAGVDPERCVRRSSRRRPVVADTSCAAVAATRTRPRVGSAVRPAPTWCGARSPGRGGSGGCVSCDRRGTDRVRRHHAAGRDGRGDLERWGHPRPWPRRCRNIGARVGRGLLRAGERTDVAAAGLGSDRLVRTGAAAGDARAMGILRVASMQLVRRGWPAGTSVPALRSACA